MDEDQMNQLIDAVWILLDEGLDKTDIIDAVYNAIDSWTPLEDD